MRVQNFAAKVRSLNAICRDMTNKIQANKAKTQDLLAKTAALQNEKFVFFIFLEIDVASLMAFVQNVFTF